MPVFAKPDVEVVESVVSADFEQPPGEARDLSGEFAAETSFFFWDHRFGVIEGLQRHLEHARDESLIWNFPGIKSVDVVAKGFVEAGHDYRVSCISCRRRRGNRVASVLETVEHGQGSIVRCRLKFATRIFENIEGKPYNEVGGEKRTASARSLWFLLKISAIGMKFCAPLLNCDNALLCEFFHCRLTDVRHQIFKPKRRKKLVYLK